MIFEKSWQAIARNRNLAVARARTCPNANIVGISLDWRTNFLGIPGYLGREREGRTRFHEPVPRIKRH
jgi:hypothetical protein